ncbi:MAG: acetate--CoA ligase family protein [Hyphomicrobiaceae bacterium]
MSDEIASSGGEVPGAMTPARRANMARLFEPRSIVFLGGLRASAAIRTTRQSGFGGEIYAVSRTRREIEGIATVPTIADLPGVPDAAFVGIPAEATVEAVRDLAAIGTGAAVCYAAGFSELGEVGAARAKALVAAAGDMAVVGPNCFGVINYVTDGSLWPLPYPRLESRRGAAIIAQSGNVCINLTMSQRSLPFSYIVSAGNQAVLGFEDYIDYLADDPAVTAIGLFMEGIRDVPAFARACQKARAKGRPVVAFRVGTSELGARLAASHTSSLAGQNELYEALFERLGVIAAVSVPEFLELLKTASVWRPVAGRRLAVISSSGGDNGMAADAASGAGLAIPPLSSRQAGVIQALLPDFGMASNPLDFTAGYWGDEARLTPMLAAMLAEGVDMGLLVIDHPLPELGPDLGKAIAAMVRAMGSASRSSGVPAAVACVNPESMPRPMREHVLAEGLLPLQGLDDAGPVLGKWATHCERLREDRAGLPLPALRPSTGAPRTLNELESKRRLAASGLPVPRSVACGLTELPDAAAGLGDRLVLKALHDDLPHKTEVGGVVLGLAPGDLEVAARDMAGRIAVRRPGLVVDRFLIEPMLASPVAELIVGIKRDPQFGLVLVVGAGGVLVELLRDAGRLLLPATAAEIEAALRRLRTFPLFEGFRGRPRGDLAATVRAILAVADHALAHRDSILEIDVNPLMVMAEGEGAMAADALVVTTE